MKQFNNRNPLSELRGIIHGWAFADQHGREVRLSQAEDWIISHFTSLHLHPDFTSHAEEIIAPLRNAVERGARS